MSNRLISISEVGAKLTIAGKLRTRPLCAYGSKTPPSGAVPSTSISWCIAQAMATVAFRAQTPPIYVAAEMPERCCPGGLAHFGFIHFNPGIKYFVSSGSKEYRNGEAEFLKATPQLFEENQRTMGKITALDKFIIIQPCAELTDKDPGVRSVLCLGTAEQIRNMVSLAQFGSHNPFRTVLVPQGSACASFVSYAAGMVEKAPIDTVFVGPADPTGNNWFPQDHLSLAMPIETARRMAHNLERSFITKRPSVAYPEQRVELRG